MAVPGWMAFRKGFLITNMEIVMKMLSDNTGLALSTESGCQCRRHGFKPLLGRSPGEGNGNPLQYSFLRNPMGKRAWQAHKSRTQ